MIEYITKATVDDLLGTGWEGTGDDDEAIIMANAWLSERQVRLNDDDTTPADVERAGAYLAELAAADSLYADEGARVKRKRVKADTVESETEYQDGAAPSSGRFRFIRALINPYTAAVGGANFVVARA